MVVQPCECIFESIELSTFSGWIQWCAHAMMYLSEVKHPRSYLQRAQNHYIQESFPLRYFHVFFFFSDNYPNNWVRDSDNLGCFFFFYKVRQLLLESKWKSISCFSNSLPEIRTLTDSSFHDLHFSLLRLIHTHSYKNATVLTTLFRILLN